MKNGDQASLGIGEEAFNHMCGDVFSMRIAGSDAEGGMAVGDLHKEVSFRMRQEIAI